MKNKFIALDIGNVCINLKHAQIKPKLGFDPDLPFPDEFEKMCIAYEYGTCSKKEWLDSFQSATGNKFSDSDLISLWNQFLGEPVDGMIETISELTELGFKFVYFSDTNPTHIESFYNSFPAHDLIYDEILSYNVGAHKPAIAMFEAFEKKFGTPCFYIDDKKINIDGALNYGWCAHQFTTTENFRSAFFEKFGV